MNSEEEFHELNASIRERVDDDASDVSSTEMREVEQSSRRALADYRFGSQRSNQSAPAALYNNTVNASPVPLYIRRGRDSSFLSVASSIYGSISESSDREPPSIWQIRGSDLSEDDGENGPQTARPKEFSFREARRASHQALSASSNDQSDSWKGRQRNHSLGGTPVNGRRPSRFLNEFEDLSIQELDSPACSISIATEYKPHLPLGRPIPALIGVSVPTSVALSITKRYLFSSLSNCLTHIILRASMPTPSLIQICDRIAW